MIPCKLYTQRHTCLPKLQAFKVSLRNAKYSSFKYLEKFIRAASYSAVIASRILVSHVASGFQKRIAEETSFVIKVILNQCKLILYQCLNQRIKKNN